MNCLCLHSTKETSLAQLLNKHVGKLHQNSLQWPITVTAKARCRQIRSSTIQFDSKNMPTGFAPSTAITGHSCKYGEAGLERSSFKGCTREGATLVCVYKVNCRKNSDWADTGRTNKCDAGLFQIFGTWPKARFSCTYRTFIGSTVRRWRDAVYLHSKHFPSLTFLCNSAFQSISQRTKTPPEKNP